ncbi:phospholipase D-like domain-containing protein [Pseudomonas lundensis]|uniref:phospholipase D-like domain-containing protein n=1 Tax=Pseudomonas lundensis TaxID=86185 RepID=UPI0039082D96
MTLPENSLPRRNILQIVDTDGNPYKAFATENIWLAPAFSSPAKGNAVKPYFNGKAYFAELITEFAAAQESIYIAGWQVNWDAQLAPKVRLYDCLLEAAQRGVNIYVMPWDDSAPVQTYDEQTERVLLDINRIIDQQRVFVTPAKSNADKATLFYSHHQKQVVIDQQVAFVGGLDLAYGRYDDDCFELRADADERQGMNRYNGCVPQLGHLGWENLINPDEKNFQVDAHQYQTPYKPEGPGGVGKAKPSAAGVDASRQPRMPWQDMHLRIEGPAVSELTRNFVLRWNGPRTVSAPNKKLLPLPPKPGTYPSKGTCSVQVLRSAPLAMQKKERNEPPLDEQPTKAQDDIYRAMGLLIEKAKHYVYIEQQFFVSDFGEEVKTKEPNEPSSTIQKSASIGPWATRIISSNSSGKVQNVISKRLIHRIGRAIMSKTTFHAYIVLPVHPEGGGLDNPAIVTQVHFTQQTISFGKQSLLKGIKAYLKLGRLYDEDRITQSVCADVMAKTVADIQKLVEQVQFKDIPAATDEECYEYVTLLNLRNWTKLYDRYVTEQIYIHSKLMIVDDRYALIGSANINDRSLLGARDSELAVLVMDLEVQQKDFLGTGKLQPARTFAHELRKGIWNKLFGISSGVRPADELKDAIDKPGHPDCWKAIQAVSKRNTEHYEAVFKFIPRSIHSINDDNTYAASIWPVVNTSWDKNLAVRPAIDLNKAKKDPMPFEAEFWNSAQYEAHALPRLNQISGFITAYPIKWTEFEDNNMKFHHALMTQTTPTEPASRELLTVPQTEKQIAALSKNKPEFRG